MIGSSTLIATIQTFYLDCVGGLQPAVTFGIVSVTEGIVKYLSSSKLKQILFPEGGN